MGMLVVVLEAEKRSESSGNVNNQLSTTQEEWDKKKIQ